MVAGDQLHAEQIGHQRGQAFFRQQLVVQQIQHKGAIRVPYCTGAATPVGKRRPGSRAAGCAAGRPCARCSVTISWPWFGQIEHLPGDMAQSPSPAVSGSPQRGADLRDNGRRSHRAFRSLAQRVARMALLPAASALPDDSPQAADPRRLLQPVARRRLAAVACCPARVRRSNSGDALACTLRYERLLARRSAPAAP